MKETLKETQAETKRPRRTPAIAGLLALVVLALLLLAGYLPRRSRTAGIHAAAARAASNIPQVSATQVRRAPENSELMLPGILTPLTEAYIYARATGYILHRYADIGDRVRAGQLLADIEAPDLDEQVHQAEAALAQSERALGQTQDSLHQAQAQLELAQLTWNRYRTLVARGVVSRQDADQQLTNLRAASAAVEALKENVGVAEQNIAGNRANLRRTLALQAFKRVTAPFAGVITARNADVGAFISGSGSTLGLSTSPAGGTQNIGAVGTAGAASASVNTAISAAGSPGGPTPGGSSNGELFRIAQSGTLRVLIDVPEESAPTIRPGLVAQLSLPAFPGRHFEGRVTRTANALDANTHTLLTEVQVRNPNGEMLPGMYAQVRIISRRAEPPFLVPGSAIIVRAEGTEVAVLSDAPGEPAGVRRIHLAPVLIGRDYGTVTEITEGLSDGQSVVVTPGDDVQEGALVRPVATPPADNAVGARPGDSREQERGGTTPGGGHPPPQARPRSNTSGR
jgi:multidrug efflux pump subunit AcrA (membrane-fusion protein)